MIIGKRIKERRKQLKISAEELGKRLGKDRSTIYRYEQGFIENLPLDILEPIAKALDTTPAYLMGWEESPINELPEPVIDDVLVELLAELSDLTEEERIKVSAFILGLKANR